MNEKNRAGRHVRFVHFCPGMGQPDEKWPVIFDGREGDRVFVRRAGDDEEGEGVYIDESEEVALRLYATHMTWPGESKPVRIVPAGREGSEVFCTRLNPREEDNGERVSWLPLEETLTPIIVITHSGLHVAPAAGPGDVCLTSWRVIPDGRDGNKVFIRTLRLGEPDPGDVVRVRFGEQVVMRPGAIVFALDQLDRDAPSFEDGYQPVTDTVWIWFRLCGPSSPKAARLLLSAAKRLDTAHRLFRNVRDERKRLDGLDPVGYEFRRTLYDTVGTGEIAVIALWRVIVLAQEMREHLGLSTPLPAIVEKKAPAVNALRDSFEHIEERALGLIKGEPHPDALSIFEWKRFLNEGVLYHGPFGLDVEGEVTEVCLALRQFLKDVASEIGTYAPSDPR